MLAPGRGVGQTRAGRRRYPRGRRYHSPMTAPTLPADFDPAAYLALNPDVRAAGVDPAEHWLAHGVAEGRRWRAAAVEGLPEDFDAEVYLRLNPDVAAAGVEPAAHYVAHGRAEGREYRPPPAALLPRIRTPYDADGLRSMHNHDFMDEPGFAAAYARGVAAAGADYQWHWRVHVGLWAARSAWRVPGDFVECGVNRGFLSSAIMQHLDWNRGGRTFWLLDTFGGLDARYVSDDERAGGVLERNRRELDSGFYTRDLDVVRANFAEWPGARIVVGSIPETLGEITSQALAFVHIDLNCSPPEVAAIDALWPRISAGGVVLLDDYAYYGYQPQKDGMDAWAAANGVAIASLPTGQGLILK